MDIINIKFNTYCEYPDSIIRTSGFIRFILLIFAFKFFYGEDPIYFKKFVLGFWFIIFLIVTVDIFFEFFMGLIFWFNQIIMGE